ncbi:MAG: SMP-30/gluconolactonase/LRE family protein [Gammaproteobacteria bacterium]|nr:SMP-30/gluconolactonase/LRE family protein [Gammaproteobacteria bacterium]
MSAGAAGRERSRLLILLVLLGLAIGLLAMTVRDRLGYGRDIEPYGADACERIPAPAGPEDLEIDELLRVAFISATPRREPGALGDLYWLDLDDPDALPVPIPRDGPELAPHGLSLVRVDGELYLHVINHADAAGSTVEQFRYVSTAAPTGRPEARSGTESGRLEHLATVSDPALFSPNDLAAVDAKRFYVTNDHGGRSPLLRGVEHVLGLRLGDVQYYDGQRFQTVATGQGFANGILLTRSGHRVLVAETVAGTVTSYLRDPASGLLTGESYMRFETGPDNLTQAADGSIWMVGHPRLVDFVAHARNPERLSPTDVYRIDFYGRTADFGAVLVDDGSLISGGSTAAVRGRQMWVGNVFDPYLLRCTLRPGAGSQVRAPAIEPTLSYQ